MTTYVLVPGMWLGAWAWRSVASFLPGHTVYPLTLTGVADRRHLPGADLETHALDVVALIEAEELTDVVLVGHSYGGFPVTVAADRIPDRLRHVVYVDSGPMPSGTSMLDSYGEPLVGGADVPPPDWASLDPAQRAGLSPTMLAELGRRATPHPYASISQPLSLTGAGDKLPRTLIACTFPVDTVRSLMAAGHPWFAGLGDATLVGLATGHWPMLSEPSRLAAALAEV
jgi:pimeloyl-ACP methyl ester carboxylesterase